MIRINCSHPLGGYIEALGYLSAGIFTFLFGLVFVLPIAKYIFKKNINTVWGIIYYLLASIPTFYYLYFTGRTRSSDETAPLIVSVLIFGIISIYFLISKKTLIRLIVFFVMILMLSVEFYLPTIEKNNFNEKILLIEKMKNKELSTEEVFKILQEDWVYTSIKGTSSFVRSDLQLEKLWTSKVVSSSKDYTQTDRQHELTEILNHYLKLFPTLSHKYNTLELFSGISKMRLNRDLSSAYQTIFLESFFKCYNEKDSEFCNFVQDTLTNIETLDYSRRGKSVSEIPTNEQKYYEAVSFVALILKINDYSILKIISENKRLTQWHLNAITQNIKTNCKTYILPQKSVDQFYIIYKNLLSNKSIDYQTAAKNIIQILEKEIKKSTI